MLALIVKEELGEKKFFSHDGVQLRSVQACRFKSYPIIWDLESMTEKGGCQKNCSVLYFGGEKTSFETNVMKKFSNQWW